MDIKYLRSALLTITVLIYGLLLPYNSIAETLYQEPGVTEGQQQEMPPAIDFESMEHDFGTIIFKSEPRTAAFHFSNTGNAPLVITRTEQSCTCISVKYPRKPVMPGEEGVVEITYSPKRDIGHFHNYVKLFSNTYGGQPVVLFVHGEVVK